jgi:hypothetical protein
MEFIHLTIEFGQGFSRSKRLEKVCIVHIYSMGNGSRFDLNCFSCAHLKIKNIIKKLYLYYSKRYKYNFFITIMSFQI